MPQSFYSPRTLLLIFLRNSIALDTSLTYIFQMKDFEWDENKRVSNLLKHGIDFIDATNVFRDKKRIELETFKNNEERFLTIGSVNQVIILVVYVVRKFKRRLISARRASIEERKYYEP